MAKPEDLNYMARALRLAEKGRYSTHPNPMVGCVLVRQGEIVGEGYHIKAGEGHAEARALAVAGDSAAGATAYVTLEPCSFHGRTPSCAEALIKAGVTRVVVAMLDPDARNSGAGMRKLEAAGLAVEVGCLEESAQQIIPGHVLRYTQSRPYVRLKLAMTLDGKTALANGESRWITSEASRADVQRLRARSAAIVTGVDTVIADDPQMSVRHLQDVPHEAAALAAERPVYILDSQLRTPEGSQLLRRSNTVVMTTVATDQNMLGEAEVLQLPANEGRVCLDAVMRELAAREHSEVLFECGATLAASLVAQQCVDELIVYTAPRLIGDTGRSLLNLPEIDRMSGLVELAIKDVRQTGPDIRITAVPVTH